MNNQEGEGILLIEDDPLVQEVVSGHLRARGIPVWIAEDSVTARQLMEEHGSEVGLLVVDSGLPVQSGESLADELKQQFGKTRVLLISGYARPDTDFPFLQKPFTGAQLVESVEQLMRAARD